MVPIRANGAAHRLRVSILFTVTPEEIDALDGLQLMQLLRTLQHAEAREPSARIRNVDVPLQITVADGGQDAKIY